MKIAILADIHANFAALTAVLADADAQDVAEIISLGDNIGYGPQPEEVVSVLRQRGIPSVMGNHELALVSSRYLKKLNPGPRKSLELNRAKMSKESLAWSAGLPAVLLRHSARFVHGSPPRSITSYLHHTSMLRLARIFSGFTERLAFYGHTHSLERFTCRAGVCRHEEAAEGLFYFRRGARYIINPGSVGQPRDAISRQAKYGIWNLAENSFTIRAVSYDASVTKKLLAQYDYPESNAYRL
ncbi:MAG: metallophosphoesterase family protein [Thermodesulfobacteriota bacterium]